MSPTGRYLWTINDLNFLNIWDIAKNKKDEIKGTFSG